jgi:hypothetical protein
LLFDFLAHVVKGPVVAIITIVDIGADVFQEEHEDGKFKQDYQEDWFAHCAPF